MDFRLLLGLFYSIASRGSQQRGGAEAKAEATRSVIHLFFDKC
jgi:hypothetical protein